MSRAERRAWAVFGILLAFIFAILATQSAENAHASPPPPPPPHAWARLDSQPLEILEHGTSWCDVLGWKPMNDQTIVDNVEYPPGIDSRDRQCLTVPARGRPAYTVTRSTATNPLTKVKAYPRIMTGCLFNLATAGYTPRPAADFGRTQLDWQGRTRSPGTWNASLDIWLRHRPDCTGQPDRAEVMVWFSYQNVAPAAGRWPVIWVAHHRYWLEHWRTGNSNGVTWNYVQFRRVHQTSTVKHLRLAAFFRAAAARHLISMRWYVADIGQGNEIWSGGRHLATRFFHVTGMPS